MTEETEAKDIKIVTYRPVEQKREYSNYIEFSSNPQEVSLKFCDVKPPPTEEELKKIEKEGTIKVPVNTEIVIPFEVAVSFVEKLKEHVNNIKEKIEKEKNK